MAEQEVNYASLVFKANQHPPPEVKKDEGTVYDEVKVKSQTTKATVDANDKKADIRRHQCQQLACCLGILCVILLVSIIAVCVYFTQLDSEIGNLTAENQQLKTQNQELEMQMNNLKETIQDMKTEWDEHNVSRAQWSIDAYCPKKGISGRNCKSCQGGWTPFQSSCYAIINWKRASWKTWERAQTNCRTRISDLLVIADEDKKVFIDEMSKSSEGEDGYWIGLKAEEGKWKWVDGSDLTEESWIEQPAPDGHCAVLVKNEGLKSVNCDEKKRWICKKNGLSV